jgi:hypothetical protein
MKSDKSLELMIRKERRQTYCHDLAKIISGQDEPSRLDKIYALSKHQTMSLTADSKARHLWFNERTRLEDEEKAKIKEMSNYLKSLGNKGRDPVSKFSVAIDRLRSISQEERETKTRLETERKEKEEADRIANEKKKATIASRLSRFILNSE